MISANPLLHSIGLYCILATFFLPHYQHQINPDGISYISIAKKYLLHDYANVINGHWGPLLSWLLIPFLILGIPSLLAVKLLLLMVGGLTIVQSDILITRLNIQRLLRYSVLYVMAVLVLFYALCTITPDLLFVFFALCYINIFLDNSYLTNIYSGILCGIVGALLFFAKNYGFPFFITLSLFIHLIFFLRTQEREEKIRIIKKYFSGMAIFFLISAMWIFLITHKYGYFTVGTAGNYNHAVFGPNSSGHPMHSEGLFDPPNSSAISIWEDPGRIPLHSWSVMDSLTTIGYQIRIIIENLAAVLYIYQDFSLLSVTLLLTAFVYLLKQGKRMVMHPIFFLLASSLVLISGYIVLYVESRYLWLCNVIILVVGAKLLDLYFQYFSEKQRFKIALSVLFAASFIFFPLESLYKHRNSGEYIWNLNKKINQFNVYGRVASDKEWHDNLCLSFFQDWRYYGERGRLSDLELEEELKVKKIDYFFVWRPYTKDISFLQKYPEITNGTMDELKIYKLR